MKKWILWSLLLLCLSISCKKYKNHPIPSIPFDIEIDMSLPSYSALTGVSGYAYATASNRNIIIYRKSYDEFVAYDRESPADGGLGCATPLTPTEANFLQLLDACSGAVFSLYDGSNISGSNFGLRQYRAIWYGGNKVRVYN